jgi:hypothetical protein
LIRHQDHVWVVQRDTNSPQIAIADEEAALTFDEGGWRVTRLPLSAFTADELRALGVKLARPIA